MDLAVIGIKLQSVGAEETERKLDQVTASAQRTEAASNKLGTAGAASTSRMKAEVDRLLAGMSALSQQVEKSNVILGASGRVMTGLAKNIDGATAAMEGLGKSAVTSGAQVQQTATTTAAAVTQGAQRIVAANNNIAASTRQTRAEMVNLSRQAQDVVVSLGSGQSLMMVALQQGAQIGDIIATSEGRVTGALGRMAASAGRFLISPTGLAGMAATAAASLGVLGTIFDSRQKQIEASLIGVGRASGQTSGSIERMAVNLAGEAGSRNSTSQFRGALGAYAGAGIDGSLLPGIARQTRGYGIATGQSFEDSQKELAAAFSDPTAGAQKLNERFGFLNQALLDYIRNAQNAGDKTRAIKALNDALAPSTQEAADKMGAFARMGEAATTALSSFYSMVERGAGRLVYGTTALEKYNEAMAAVTAFEQGYAGRTMTPRQQATLESRRQRAEALRTPEAMAQQRRLEEQRAAIERAATSRRASGVVGGLFEDVQRRQDLTSQRAVLIKALGDPQTIKEMGAAGERAQEALDALTTSLDNFETQADKIAKDNELSIASTLAYTFAEKTAVEMERARTEAVRAGRSELQATTEAEQARQRALADATRQAQNMARDARQQLGMIGLSPFQQRQQAIKDRFGNFRTEFGGDGGGPAQSRATSGPPAIEYGTGLVPTGGLRFDLKAKVGSITKEEFLDAVMRFESGGRNIHQNVVPPGGGYNPSTGTVTPHSSAQGYFQITNTTWRGNAARAGVDLSQYPTAMTAPYDVQRKVAGALYDANGTSDWAPYNARLRGWMAGRGGGGIPAAANSNNPSAATQTANATERDLLTGEQRKLTEDWSSPLAAGTRALEERKRALDDMRSSIGMTTAQLAEMAERQRLVNQYTQDGITPTGELKDRIDQLAAAAGRRSEEERRTQETIRGVTDWNNSLGDATKGLASDLLAGRSAAEAFRSAIGRLADKAHSGLIDMIFNANGAQGGLLGTIFRGFGIGTGAGAPLNILPSAKGNVFGPSRLSAFADQIVTRPTAFAFAKGAALGVMGEEPGSPGEAIMPLARRSDGRLGVVVANDNRGSSGRGAIYMSGAQVNIYGNVDNRSLQQMKAILADHENRMQEAATTGRRAATRSNTGVSRPL